MLLSLFAHDDSSERNARTCNRTVKPEYRFWFKRPRIRLIYDANGGLMLHAGARNPACPSCGLICSQPDEYDSRRANVRKSNGNRQAVQDREPMFCALIGGVVDRRHQNLSCKNCRDRDGRKDSA